MLIASLSDLFSLFSGEAEAENIFFLFQSSAET